MEGRGMEGEGGGGRGDGGRGEWGLVGDGLGLVWHSGVIHTSILSCFHQTVKNRK